MKLFANINKSSKYFSGQHQKEPFEVTLQPTPDVYCWNGNSNQYRTVDLDFFVKLESGEFVPHGLLKVEFSFAERFLDAVFRDLTEISKSKTLDDKDYLYEFHGSAIMRSLKDMQALLPKQQPVCAVCEKSYRRCECE